jgi:site-specific recombinase XerC
VENPFVNVLRYLDNLPSKKKTSNSYRGNLEHVLNNFHPDSNKQIRDKVIFLLNYRYNLKPSEIVGLNLKDVNLESGLIAVASKKDGIVALRNEDILAFRQWSAIRQMYQRTDSSDNALLISLHWTLGRGLPYSRLSTRAVNYVINRSLDQSVVIVLER